MASGRLRIGYPNPSTYTIVAGPGSFALNGQAATLSTTGDSGSTDTSQIAMYQNFSALTVGNFGVNVTTSEATFYSAVASAEVVNTTVEAPFTKSLREFSVAGVDDPSMGHVWTFANHLSKGDEAWYSKRVFYPVGFSFQTSTHLKWMRWDVGDAGANHLGFADIYLSGPAEDPGGGGQPEVGTGWQFINEAAGDWKYFDHSGLNGPVLGVWETYDYYIYVSDVPVDSGGQSRIRFWKNKVLLGDVTDRQTLSVAGGKIMQLLSMTYWNGNAPQNQSRFVQQSAVAVKRASPARDDSVHLAQDASGNRLIALGM